MFSAKERSSGKGPDLDLWRKARKLLASKTGSEFRPRLSMRMAHGALRAGDRLRRDNRLRDRASYPLRPSIGRARPLQAGRRPVRGQVQRLRERGEPVTEQRINAFARSHGLEWGIVRIRGWPADAWEPGDWSPRPVRRAVEEPEGRATHGTDQDGSSQGTAAGHLCLSHDVDVKGIAEPQPRAIASSSLHGERRRKRAGGAEEYRAIGPTRRRPGATHRRVRRVLRSGLISRRVSRLGLAPTPGSRQFDARITTRVEDEVGSLGATFKRYGGLPQEAFDQIGRRRSAGRRYSTA